MTQENNASQPVPRATARSWAALVVLTVGVTILSIDNTVLALAMPALSEALEPTSVEMLWIGDIYAFTLAGFLVTGGNMADRFGRRKVLLIGLVGFGLFSMAAAWAPTAGVLIFIRALLGIFAALIMPGTLALVRTIFLRDGERTLAVAIWSAGSTGGMALGPAVGGFLLEHAWWGSVFLINTPIMALTIIGVLALVPETRRERNAGVDVLSALMSIAAVLIFVYGIKEIARSGGSPLAIPAIAVGVVLGALFIRRQTHVPNPVLNLNLFKVPSFSWALVVSLLTIFSFSGLFFFFGQYLQLVRGLSPLKAGGVEIAAMVFAALAVLALPPMVRLLGSGRALAVAIAFMSAGFIAVAATASMPGFAAFGIALALIGFGAGVAYPVATDILLAAAPPEESGAASSVSQTAYQLGTALGIAVLGSLVSGVYRVSLPELDDSPLSRLLQESLASAVGRLQHGDAASQALLDQAREAFAFGMQVTSATAAVLLAICVIIAWVKIAPRPGREFRESQA